MPEFKAIDIQWDKMHGNLTNLEELNQAFADGWTPWGTEQSGGGDILVILTKGETPNDSQGV